jgi:hypothetical protein
MHPKVVCWHGTRSIPPYPTGRGELSPDEFMEGLLACGEACQWEKVFGGLHGYYGTQAKAATEKRDGLFSHVYRDPVHRLNSLLHLNVPILTGSKADVFEQIASLVPASLGERAIYEHLTDATLAASPAGRILEMFRRMAQQTLHFDLECYRACQPSQLITMEEMVMSAEYFRDRVWPNVAPELDIDGLHLRVFDRGNVNQHVREKLSPTEVLERWPDTCRRLLVMLAASMNLTLIDEMYASLGYAKLSSVLAGVPAAVAS